MFSFMNYDDKKGEATEVEESQQSVSNGALFGGMDLKNSAESGATSSFSFMNNGPPTGNDTAASPPPPQAVEVSSFSFLQSQDSANDQKSKSSGFTFIATKPPTPGAAAEDGEQQASSFSFMSGETPTQPPFITSNSTSTSDINDLLSTTSTVPAGSSSSISNVQANIKLNRTSAPKVVKKKKRSTKVGFARDDEAEEVEVPVSSSSSSSSSSTTVPAASINTVLSTGGSHMMAPSAVEKNANAISAMQLVVEPNAMADASSSDTKNDAAVASSAETIRVTAGAGAGASINRMSSSAVSVSPDRRPPAVPTSAQPGAGTSTTTTTTTTATTIVTTNTGSGGSDRKPLVGATSDTTATSAASNIGTSAISTITPAAAAATTAATTTAAAAETPQQKLEKKSKDSVSALTKALANLSRLHTSAVSGQQKFRHEIEAETTAVQNCRQRLKEAEKEQARLAQAEEFDKADAVNEIINSTTADLSQRLIALDDLKASAKLLETTFAEERADCIDSFQTNCKTLKATRDQLTAANKQRKNAAERHHDLEDARIRSELDRISLEKNHILKEEQSLLEDTSRTEEAIQSQSGDLSTTKETIEKDLSTVEEEIRALEEKLAKKRSEKEGLVAELGLVDSKIGEVRKKYDRQLQRIADRRDTLLQAKQECAQEEDTANNERTQLDGQLKLYDEEAATALEKMKLIDADIFIADTLLSNLGQSVSSSSSSSSSSLIASISSLDASSAEEVGESGGDIDVLSRALDMITLDLASAQEELSQSQESRESLLADNKRLDEQIPKLEAEKKSHASSKRFKEAAAVAKDLKELVASKDIIDASIASTDKYIQTVNVKMEQLENDLVLAIDALKDARQQQEIVRFEALLKRGQEVKIMQHVVKKHVKLRAVDKPTQEQLPTTTAATMNAEDSDICIATLAFLDAELQAVLRAAGEIKDQYCLSHSIDIQEIVDDEDESQREGEEGSSNDRQADDDNGTAGEDDVHGASSSSKIDNIEGGGGDSSRGEKEEEEEEEEEEEDDDDDGDDDDTANGKSVEGEAEVPVVAAAVELNEANRLELITEVKALLANSKRLNEELELASDNEDYEKAAELFEEITAIGENVDEILVKLNCSKADLED